jgi:hypothetical protein
MKLDPQYYVASSSGEGSLGATIKTVPGLSKEVSKMKRHIQDLDKKLTLNDAGISYDAYTLFDD